MYRYRLRHITEFSYDAPVSESYNEVRLRPMQGENQSCLSFRLSTDPLSNAATHFDYFGNYVHRFNVPQKHRRLRVEAESVVLMQAPPMWPTTSLPLSSLPDQEAELDEWYDYRRTTKYVPFVPDLQNLVERAEYLCDGTCGGFALAVMRLVHKSFRYEKGATHVRSSVPDSIAVGAGVCQDFAHIALGLLRMKGLPARYVSGYLIPQRTAEAATPSSVRNIEEIAGGQASHAWIEVLLPGNGWFGLDPTIGAVTGERHVRVAYGCDYGDAAPLRGVYRGKAGQQMSVDVEVRPALDQEGREHLQELSVPAPPDPPADDYAQQQQQQQQ